MDDDHRAWSFALTLELEAVVVGAARLDRRSILRSAAGWSALVMQGQPQYDARAYAFPPDQTTIVESAPSKRSRWPARCTWRSL